MTTSTIEKRIEYALENSDHHTLTEIAMELDGDEELLAIAKRMKQEEHDAHFGYDEERDNED
jgi:hypothetical protein